VKRKITFTVSDEGRDNGKCFVIEELPASRAEKWAIRAMLALGRAGVEVSESDLAGGMESLARLGYSLLSKISFEEAEPLLDEMWNCVQIQPDPRNPDVVRMLIEDDIFEPMTRMRLRVEVLKLHMGFLRAAGQSDSPLGQAAGKDSSKQ
jgi:hypothetical protein